MTGRSVLLRSRTECDHVQQEPSIAVMTTWKEVRLNKKETKKERKKERRKERNKENKKESKKERRKERN